MLAAFKRAQTWPLDLIDIELETHQSVMLGDGYKVVAFVRDCGLNAQHILPGDHFPTDRQLIGAAEVLAQHLSMEMRRRQPYGRERATGGLQQRQRAASDL